MKTEEYPMGVWFEDIGSMPGNCYYYKRIPTGKGVICVTNVGEVIRYFSKVEHQMRICTKAEADALEKIIEANDFLASVRDREAKNAGRYV